MKKTWALAALGLMGLAVLGPVALAAGAAGGCAVERTRPVTRYREETYQAQVGTRPETRYREETRYRTETYTVPVQRSREVTRYREETYTVPETRYRTETYTVSVPHRVSYAYRVPHTGRNCWGWGRWRRCHSYTYYTTHYVNYTYYTTEVRTRQVAYTVSVTRTRQVPYQATEWYTAYEPRTRQVAYTVRVPYTVEVPVYATQVRQVPYQAQETYLDDSACPRYPTRRVTQGDRTGAPAYGPGEAAATGAPLRLAQPWWLQVGQVAVGVHEVAFRKVEFVNKSFEPHAPPSGRLTSALSAKLALIRLPGQFLWPDGSRSDIASQAAQGVVDAYEGWSLVHQAAINRSGIRLIIPVIWATERRVGGSRRKV